MNEEQRIMDKFGNKYPGRVPDGYFESFAAGMTESLPEFPCEPKPAPMTLWQRLKPYTYMAAMFAGIWLMMNVFHRVSGAGQLSLDNPPENIAHIMEQSEVMDYYTPVSALEDMEAEMELCESYTSMEDFEKDFGYSLTPEYAGIEINRDVN